MRCSIFVNITIFNACSKNCNKIFTCKHCELIFNSNNKFHEHVKLHHDEKNYDIKTLRQRFVEKENKHINLLVTFVFVTILINFFVTFVTSSITFKSMSISTKSSNLFNFMTKKQVVCFNTFSFDFFNTSTNLIASTVHLKLIQDHKFLTTIQKIT